MRGVIPSGFFLIVLLFSFPCKAQDGITRKSVKMNSSQPDAPTGAQHSKKQKAQSTQTLSYYAVKADIGQVFFGHLPLGVEYAPLEWLSVEAGVGPTFRNYFGSVLSDREYQEINGVQPEIPWGFGYNILAKAFYDGYALEGDGYIGLLYGQRLYRSSYRLNGRELEERDRISEFGAVYGSQLFLSDNFFLDAYFGLTIRNLSGTYVEEFYDLNGNTTYEETEKQAESSFGFLLSLKLGYLFD